MAGHRDDGTFAEDKAHHPNRRPPKMEDYLGRLMHPPKRDYATALSDAIMSGSDHPEAPAAPWASDVQKKTMRYMGTVNPKSNAIPDAGDPAGVGEANHDARLEKGAKSSPKKKSSGSFNPTCGTCKGSGVNQIHKQMFGSTVACGSCKGDGLSPRGRKFMRDEIGD